MKEVELENFNLAKAGIYFFDMPVSKDQFNPMLETVIRGDSRLNQKIHEIKFKDSDLGLTHKHVIDSNTRIYLGVFKKTFLGEVNDLAFDVIVDLISDTAKQTKLPIYWCCDLTESMNKRIRYYCKKRDILSIHYKLAPKENTEVLTSV